MMLQMNSKYRDNNINKQNEKYLCAKKQNQKDFSKAISGLLRNDIIAHFKNFDLNFLGIIKIQL